MKLRILVTLSLLMAFFPITAVAEDSGLIAWYSFEGDVKDYSGYSNNGYLFGGKFVEGLQGKGVYFDGVDDYIRIKDSGNFENIKTLTIEVWIKTQDTQGVIVAKESNGVYTGFNLMVQGDGRVVFQVGREQTWSPFGVVSSDPVNDGKWHFIAGVFDGRRLKIYLDGELSDSLRVSSIPVIANSRDIVVGRNPNMGGKEFKGIIDELKIYNRSFVDGQIRNHYEAIKYSLNEVVTPQVEQLGETPPLVPTPVSASEEPSRVGKTPPKIPDKKILLDSGVEIIDRVNYGGVRYYVVKYRNILPYASGVEILSSDGSYIIEPEIAKLVLTQTAWKEAARELKPSDIDTLKAILRTSQNIHNAVSPVVSITQIVVGEINRLESIQVMGHSVWDIIKKSYPGISILEKELRSLHSELIEWENISDQITNSLPKVIDELEALMNNGETDTGLQADIQESISAFKDLKTKTDEMNNKLSEMITILSEAERSIRSAGKSASIIPLVGSSVAKPIYGLADLVGSLNDELKSLKEEIQSFSAELSEESLKLSSMLEVADKKTSELYRSWDSRRNAAVKVYGTLGGVFIGVGILLIYIRKRSG